MMQPFPVTPNRFERMVTVTKKKTSFIIDFQKLRNEKQAKAEDSLTEVYDLFFTFIERQANLREKVRAKRLFSHKVNYPENQVFDRWIQLQFEHWFAFDYVTVIGSRMFDLFVREHRHQLSAPMLDLCGHLMLMSLEPAEVTGKGSGGNVKVKRLVNNEMMEVTSFLSDLRGEEGDLVFMRFVPVGFKTFAAGPAFTVAREEKKQVTAQLEGLLTEKRKDSPAAVTRYMKEYGIDYLRYAERRNG
ncbi:hypothetical protein CR205_00770 [Alteribacter lacisalsi]|uniref:Uncharacterized protein n=1 Tax=Alteribacter lacisalsi TaxID=2045244 RepID=A0A2W0H7Q8_9BACI|nr:hypothetical protein [Alteribacter lacisalsi]PYZ97167.1 hypothetical protein CR205_00770 [Alteribacter lacisalsi]